ncbi:DUF4160 domain-containing protein [Fretibacter rubidus]|uniref:DUF4160 domain-containing protein n=1 Tax=Fretibacter rubidus TaxID=570162 RepID=UPI00352B1F6F
MPTVLRWKGYKFFFYSDEEDRPHIHIIKQNAQAKYWLNDVEFVKAEGFSQKELNVLFKKVAEEQDLFLERWNDYFNA